MRGANGMPSDLIQLPVYHGAETIWLTREREGACTSPHGRKAPVEEWASRIPLARERRPELLAVEVYKVRYEDTPWPDAAANQKERRAAAEPSTDRGRP